LFVTSFLEKQVRARGLEQPTGRGRIWRVRNANAPRGEVPALGEASWADLAAALESDNGWVRDRVQQIFVEEGAEEQKAHDVLRELLRTTQRPLARLHALWALSGMRGVTPELSHAMLADPDERVREAALRTSEALVGSDPAMLATWLALARGDSAAVRAQVLLSLGEVHTDAAERALFDLMAEDASHPAERSWVLSSLARRELFFLERLLASSQFEAPNAGYAELLKLLATVLAREGNHANISSALDALIEGRRPTWQREALIAGLLAGRSSAGSKRPAALRLIEEPRAFAPLLRLAEQLGPQSGASLNELAASISWPGHPLAGEEPVRALDAAERASFERGRQFFATICAGCHQSSGQGMAGMAPSLRGSPWLLDDGLTAARIVLFGIEGPIVVEGETWDLAMPAVAGTDAELADALTYVRREWGHAADPVSASTLKELRAAAKGRTQPWTAAELEALQH
jgi:mono/diheme cytochrome c family protein